MEQGQIIVIGIVLFYFLPAIISIFRQLQNSNTICLLNLLLGWTIIGWVCAFIAALSSKTRVQKKQEEAKEQEDRRIYTETTSTLAEMSKILQGVHALEGENKHTFKKGGIHYGSIENVNTENLVFKEREPLTHSTILKTSYIDLKEKEEQIKNQNKNREGI